YDPFNGYSKQADFTCAANGGLAFPFSGPTRAPDFNDQFIGTTTNGNTSLGGDNGGFYFLNGSGAMGLCQLDGSDGAHPYAGATEIQTGGGDDIYIPASEGGSSNFGTVMEFVGSSCNARVLHNFTGGNDGATPYGTLWYDGNSFLYGTTR